MSLLNDMLCDLSHSQKNAEAISVSALELQQDEQRELLNQSSVIKPEPGKLWPSVAVFICVFFALWVWKQTEWVAAPAQVVIDSPVAAIGATQKKSTINQISGEQTITAQANVDQVTVADENLALVQEVTAKNTDSPKAEMPTRATDSTVVLNERLAALETAITKLSHVVEESQTTTTDTVNAEARNQEMAEALNQETAEVLNEETISIERTQTDESPASVSIRDPFAQDYINDRGESKVVGAAKQSPVESSDNTIPAGAHLSVKPNAAFLDQRHAEQGRQLAAQGQPSDAIIALQAFIAQAQEPGESTRALLDIFVEQENIAAIESLLAQADYLSQLDKQFYAAKVAIIQQREDSAIELLEAQVTQAEAQESYRALLAGLYQRAGKYAEAASAYRRLLGSFGEKPAYWLGLALAQDSLSQSQTARQAYLRVAEYPDLQPEVRAYIQQRLTALQ